MLSTRNNPGGLTVDEIEIINLLWSGLNCKEISIKRGSVRKTVENQVFKIKKKLGIYRPSLIFQWALKNDIIQAPLRVR